ncbi:hypothetical protein [Paenibacillus etheri]|uniref:hypothetical protein n=1 Tax=Paenibacillus etheri TaxID=1306852 RepID=UPI000FBA3388|nr:hypothetical protein [Paenibacillus etheri]
MDYGSVAYWLMKLQESKAPYGSVVAALATLMKSYEGSEQNVIKEGAHEFIS